ncbi:MAG: serine/threonine-protein kinase, partial [Planctomycetota bacterium]
PANTPDAAATANAETLPVAQLSTQYSENRTGFYDSIARVGIEAAEAIHYAHECGVIHRDVKPSNLLLDQAGRVHVADFGLALMQNAGDLTMTGDVVGTLRYMSPEQLESASSVDRRSDVYSLGATLYEMLSGRPAIDATQRTDLLRRIAEVDAARLRKWDARMPADLETIVLKCLAKSPEDRYQTAGDLADDLTRFRERRPIAARKSSAWKKGWRWAQRHRKLAAACSVAVAALTTLAVAGPIAAWALRNALVAEQDVTQRLQAQAYDMRIRDAAHAISLAHYRRAELMLEHCDESLRDFEWFHLWSQVKAERRRVVANEHIAVLRADVSPNGKLVAFGNWFGAVQIFDRERRQSVADFKIHPTDQAIPLALRFDPAGELLFAGGERHAVLWNSERGQPAKAWQSDAQISAGAFSPDGALLAIGYMADIKATRQTSDPVAIEVLEIAHLVDAADDVGRDAADGATGRNGRMLDGPSGRVYKLEISPDGRTLAACSNAAGVVHRWSLPSLKELPPLVVEDPVVETFAFHPGDSDILAVASGVRNRFGQRSSVTLYSLKTGERLRFVHGSDRVATALQFSANGKQLILGDGEG